MRRETGDQYYPQLSQIRYPSDEKSVYGEPDEALLSYLHDIHGKIILDPTVGDGKYVPQLLAQNNFIVAGDLNKTIDVQGTSPLAALRNKLSPEQQKRLTACTMNAFDHFPFSDTSFDAVINTGFLYLFPEELIQRNIDESARVLKKEGLLVFDFATNIQRSYLDTGEPVPQTTKMQYTTERGVQLVKRVLGNTFDEPEIILSHIDQQLTSANYRMITDKLNVRARRK